MDEEGQTSLLGDGESIRVQLEAIKDRIERGPAILKVVCAVLCGVAVVLDVLAIVTEVVTLQPFQVINTAYACSFALLGFTLEVQQAYFVNVRRWINVWFKMLNRTWGKGFFYLMTAGFHFSSHSISGYIIGGLFVACGALSIWVSRAASNKLRVLHAKIVKDHTNDLVYVRQVFNRMDMDNSGYLSSAELASACKELGSEFYPNELVAIFNYLSNGDDKLSYSEFEAFWTGENMNELAWDKIPLV